MGAEIAFQKNRTVSPSDENRAPRINNFYPLRFHQVHGENVTLLKNGTVACRPEGFCKGIAFSDRPIMILEHIYVKFLEISANWSGALRIGFTMNDPVSMKSKLPRYACPDLTSMHGNWVKAVAERMAKKDSILFYYVDANGDVHYGIDAEEHGVFFGGVNTSGKLWAVLDIYGNTVSVEFVDPGSFDQEFPNDSLPNNLSFFTRNIESDSACSTMAALNSSFHPVHGKNIILKMNRNVASRKYGFHSLAYVFILNSLTVDRKILIEVLQTSNSNNQGLVYGITSCDPSTLSSDDLPENADDLFDRSEYWIVENDLNVYKKGDVLLYTLSADGKLSVLKNCKDESAVLHVDPTQSLWLFFNIAGSISEIRILDPFDCDTDAQVLNRLANLKVSLPSKVGNAELPGSSGQQSYNECIICYEESVNCALYRCGHMCMCHKCALEMFKPGSNTYCPICRKPVQDVIKIYR